jgi:hypothetical protein
VKADRLRDELAPRSVTENYGSASIGPYTQPDPIGFAGGLNLYGYAGGDPVNNADPFGLSHCWTRVISHDIPEQLGGGSSSFRVCGEHSTVENVGWGAGGGPSLLGGEIVDLCSVDRDACDLPHIGIERLGPRLASSSRWSQCTAGVLAAIYASAEDLSYLIGVGFVLKGVRGARIGIQAARVGAWTVADRLGTPHAGVVINTRAMSRTAGSGAWMIGWSASTQTAMGLDFTAWDVISGLIPVYNMANAIGEARSAC